MDYVKLTENEKKELLRSARSAIEYYFDRKDINEIKTSEKRLYELKLGCFVTLKKHHSLRGCIGTFSSRENLFDNVKKMAVASAFEDPRFDRLDKKELNDVCIEISVLYPLIKVNSLNEIQVGRDGLYVVYNYYSGVLLPQVATEYGWNRDEFLSHTCQKAGLPGDAWKRFPIEIYRFEAEIFNEQES